MSAPQAKAAPPLIEVHQVNRADLDNVEGLRDVMASFLQLGFDHSRSLDDTDRKCFEAVDNETTQLHAVLEGAQMVGAIATFINVQKDGSGALVIWCIGGERMVRWKQQALEHLERVARQYGCSSLELGGRVGWLRELKRDGYYLESVILRKVLK